MAAGLNAGAWRMTGAGRCMTCCLWITGRATCCLCITGRTACCLCITGRTACVLCTAGRLVTAARWTAGELLGIRADLAVPAEDVVAADVLLGTEATPRGLNVEPDEVLPPRGEPVPRPVGL